MGKTGRTTVTLQWPKSERLKRRVLESVRLPLHVGNVEHTSMNFL